MTTRKLIEASSAPHAFGPADPERRKRQLKARAPGHDTAMMKKRSDQDAKDLVSRMTATARAEA